MRITNRMVTAQFTRSLNDMSVELNRLNNQIVTGRKFAKASENTSAAIKGFQIRKDMSRAESYLSNIHHAQSSLTDAEASLMHMNELMTTAKERIIFGINDTQSQDERKVVAGELRNLQDQLFQTLNSATADSYYFGGTVTKVRPFEVDVNGKLDYVGNSESLFVDIGLNVKYDSSDPSQPIDGSTVFSYSISGLDIVGHGADNLYDLLGELADELESDTYSYDKANELFGKIDEKRGNITAVLTDIGAKTSYLEFMEDRIEDRMLNFKDRQLKTEGIDPAEAIINFESQKFAYTAALQMGSQILQPTVFDFMK